ncbi:hypothetical protein [Xenorhabdus sp. KK7.4]|uniref:hypothetical protein n=1 Tax=Xenorhabdus sp. KK7.4 TaxID=1851572 RepID=UPI000C04372C|nr:hypothetical protein [Xenorhabdus sp. KK7.4]PHM56692.1 hypothetical protein Xekk_01924 [Xenorhabdus sp. KK7.4]
MEMGLEIYDEQGRVIITTNNIIPRFLGTHMIPLNKTGSLYLPGLSEGGNVTARFFLRMRSSGGSGIQIAQLSNEFTTFSVSGSTFSYTRLLSSEIDTSGFLSCIFIPSSNQQYTLLNNMKAVGDFSAGEHQ